MPLTPARYLSLLTDQTALLAVQLTPDRLDRQVPTCPAWSLAALARHLGLVQRWVLGVIDRGSTEPPPEERSIQAPPESGAPTLAAWLQDGAGQLAAAIREAGAEAPIWTWSGDLRVAFWLRRMALEAAVHAVDGQLVSGAARDLPSDLAADGVDEWLWILSLPTAEERRPDLRALRGDGQTLHLHATDEGIGEAGEWIVRRTPDGIEWEHGHAKGDVAVRGGVSDLYLLLMRRLAPDARIQVLGERALLDHWLQHTPF